MADRRAYRGVAEATEERCAQGLKSGEGQRLGRILRPKKNGVQVHFYALVTRDTLDQTFAANRQLFLTEQGYRYTITDHV